MKFISKTKQKFQRNESEDFVRAELNYHDMGDYFVAEGRYFVTKPVEGSQDGEVELVWQEPIKRTFTRDEAEVLESTLQVSAGDSILDGWDNLKAIASLYILSGTSGFGEFDLDA